MSGNSSEPTLASLSARMDSTDQSLNDFFLCTMAIVIYFMQCGFAFLEAGAVRSKNVTNILIKNILDSFIGGIAYYLIGYALAFGEPGNAFCGGGHWALSQLPATSYSRVLFQFMFAATAATIVSGAVAERCEFTAYLIYTAFITGFIYPVVTHWAWTPTGWLAKGIDITYGDGTTIHSTYQDFAGSGVVHIVGGSAAFVAAAILGPRIGRFDASAGGRPREIRGHSVPLASLGAFILYFGFFAFNGGSQASIAASGDGQVVALAMVNTCLSGSSGAIVTMLLGRLRSSTWSLLATINGGLAGMVAICAGCNSMHPWGAVATGAISAVFYLACAQLVLQIGVDDPLEAVGVHFGGGLAGLILVPFFHKSVGVFISPSRQTGTDLVWQLAGAGAIIAWSAGLAMLLFGALRLARLLRVTEELEVKGLDVPKHAEPAYPLVAYGHGWGDGVPDLSPSGMEAYMHSRWRDNSTAPPGPTAQSSSSNSGGVGGVGSDGRRRVKIGSNVELGVRGGHDNAGVDMQF